jgi:tetratricopeptide (TPR) repeat protein
MRARQGVALSVLLALVASIHAYASNGAALDVVLSLASLWVVFTASVFAHELGHALGARTVGLRPFVLIVGGGPNLVLRDVAGVAIDVGFFPGDGLTLIASRDVGPRIKWRLLLTYASGPAVSAALLAAGLLAFPEQWREYTENTHPVIAPGAALVLANGLLLLSSIIPLPRPSDVISPRNDLVQILTLPFLKASAFAGLAKASRAMAVYRFFQLRKYQDAFDEARRELAEDPSNFAVRLQVADMLIFSRRYPEAAREYAILMAEPALNAEGVPKVGAALVANNCAWANYMSGGADELALADRASEQALALAPNNPHVLGTRGAILVSMGSLAKGRELLERARKLHRDPRSQASNVACLALAAFLEGRPDEARRLLEQAGKLDPECELLAHVETALDSR